MSTAPHHQLDRADDEMLTIEEAAELLRVPIATLRYWRYAGTGPRSIKVMRHVRYWRSDITLWLTEHTSRPQDAN